MFLSNSNTYQPIYEKQTLLSDADHKSSEKFIQYLVTRINLTGLFKNIRITDIRDRHHGDTEIFTARRSERDIVSVEMMHGSFGKHSIVLNLRFSQLGTVVRNKNELGCECKVCEFNIATTKTEKNKNVHFPLRRLLIVCFVPRAYLPDLTIRASEELILSPCLDFFFDETMFYISFGISGGGGFFLLLMWPQQELPHSIRSDFHIHDEKSYTFEGLSIHLYIYTLYIDTSIHLYIYTSVRGRGEEREIECTGRDIVRFL